MPSQYTKRDKLLGVTTWLGYIISAPIRIIENYPRPAFSNPLEDGINPRIFVD